MAPIDPHSFADSEHPFTSHVDLSLYFNFDSGTIHGSAVLTLERSYTGDLYLDTRSLSIHGVHGGSSTSNPIPFSLENPHPVKGTLLRISLADQICFRVTFTTHKSAQALHWLSPAQTAEKNLPYVYTQCHPIFARTIFPCQDTPRARIRYRALLNIPRGMSAVMSACHVGADSPRQGEARGACRTGNLVTHATCNDLWLNEGFTTYAERRIIEVLQGEERAALIIALGWYDLKGVVERFKNNMELTKLRTNLEGVDPDYAFAEVAYEKVYQFICRLERQIVALDEQFQFNKSGDWEIKVAFLMIVAYSGYKPYFKAIENNLHEVGRLRFLRHLYTCLLQGTFSKNGGRDLAKQVYKKAKKSYHPIAQCVVESLLAKYT